MYLRRAGWTDQQQFSIRTVAGELRPTILSDTTCRVDMGRARDEGTGEIDGFALPAGERRQPAVLDPPAVGGGPRGDRR